MVEKRKIKVSFRTEREARNVLREIHSRAVIRTDNGIYVELYPKTIDILKTTPSVTFDGEFYTSEDREPKPPKKPKVRGEVLALIQGQSQKERLQE